MRCSLETIPADILFLAPNMSRGSNDPAQPAPGEEAGRDRGSNRMSKMEEAAARWRVGANRCAGQNLLNQQPMHGNALFVWRGGRQTPRRSSRTRGGSGSRAAMANGSARYPGGL